MTVRAGTGTASMAVVSDTNQALLNVTSGGTNDAGITVAATASQNAALILESGTKKFYVMNSGSADALLVRDNTNQLLSIARVSGTTTLRGNMAIGNSTGSKSMTVKSTSGSATLTADGAMGATIAVKAGSSQEASISLSSGTKSVSMVTDYAGDKFALKQGTTDLFTVARGTGTARVPGNLTVGGAVSGARSMVVKSSDNDASLRVEAGSSGTASLTVKAAAGQNARMRLAEGTKTFDIVNDGSQDKLAFRDGSHDLMTIARTSGATMLRGNLTVGGYGGAMATTIKSSDSSAALSVEAATAATISVQASNGSEAMVELSSATKAFRLIHKASTDQLVLSDATNDLITVARGTGHTAMRGNLTIGSATTTGARSMSIKSASGSTSLDVTSTAGPASMQVTAGGNHTALIAATSASGQDSKLSLVEGVNAFDLIHAGSDDTLKVRGSTGGVHKDLITVARATGDSVFTGAFTGLSSLDVRGNASFGGSNANGTRQLQVQSQRRRFSPCDLSERQTGSDDPRGGWDDRILIQYRK
jgi:hypothetical protein